MSKQLGFLPTLSPAFGRDYETAKDVCAALNVGKDFSVGGGGGPYISLGEILELRPEGSTFNVRYKKLYEVVVLRVVGRHVVIDGATEDEELSEAALLDIANRRRESGL